MNVIFAGTPEFAAIQLNALLGIPTVNIVAVYTQPDRPSGRGKKLQPSPVKQLAMQHNIAVEQPQNFKAPESIEILRHYDADVMIVAAYGLLLPQTVLDSPKHGCINVHASILPRWRGAAPIQHAILSGDQSSGITLMKMDIGLDTGDMLWIERVDIKPEDNAQTLHDKLATLGAKTLQNQLENIVYHPNPVPQDDALATYAPKVDKADAQIHWHQEQAKQIELKVRAFNPWPGAFTFLESQRIKIHQCHLTNIPSTKPAGSITAIGDNGISVATTDFDIQLTIIQLPGKKALPVKSVLQPNQLLFGIDKQFGSLPAK